ncbi:MAG: hypothetical protein KGJ07_03670 [Patescibacteria group bacterium]|nr:hypothetical protein [Patescibacteria group bacterium]
MEKSEIKIDEIGLIMTGLTIQKGDDMKWESFRILGKGIDNELGKKLAEAMNNLAKAIQKK